MKSRPPASALNIWQILARFSQIGFMIAIPLVVLIFAGAKLDQHFATSPMFLFFGLSLSVITTAWTIYKMVKDLLF